MLISLVISQTNTRPCILANISLYLAFVPAAEHASAKQQSLTAVFLQDQRRALIRFVGVISARGQTCWVSLRSPVWFLPLAALFMLWLAALVYRLRWVRCSIGSCTRPGVDLRRGSGRAPGDE